jgi:hypothetical protein
VVLEEAILTEVILAFLIHLGHGIALILLIVAILSSHETFAEVFGEFDLLVEPKPSGVVLGVVHHVSIALAYGIKVSRGFVSQIAYFVPVALLHYVLSCEACTLLI